MVQPGRSDDRPEQIEEILADLHAESMRWRFSGWGAPAVAWHQLPVMLDEV